MNVLSLMIATIEVTIGSPRPRFKQVLHIHFFGQVSAAGEPSIRTPNGT
jgi:hypothetical protein